MKILSTVFLTIFSFLFLAVSVVIAGGFSLTAIGSMSLEGTTYPQYWYIGANPTLSGTAPVGQKSSIAVDGVSGTLTVDASGNWTFPTAMAEGDHVVTLSSGSGVDYTFTLTIGETPEGVGAIEAGETPAAGVSFPTIIMFTFGLFFISASFILFNFREGREY